MGGEGERISKGVAGVARKMRSLLAFLKVPKPNGAVRIALPGEQSPGECEREDELLSQQRLALMPGGDLPQMDEAIGPAHGQDLAVRRKRHRPQFPAGPYLQSQACRTSQIRSLPLASPVAIVFPSGVMAIARSA
jgi:hypothetical protein